MNRILFKRAVAALGVALCLTLAACGGGGDDDSTAPPASGQTDQPPPPADGSTASPMHCAP